MSNPWSSLDADTASKKLYLDPEVMPKINGAIDAYKGGLQSVINASVSDTTGFGNDNPFATALKKAFDTRGATLTNYVKQQLTNTEDFVQTANDAVTAFQNQDRQ
ncbi:hypothetical protein [Mycobacteroides saopaulense]|uniref:PE domain-containing protein n=1 Tax=Mycobacteroides saopaulense TaxID=1578165 RepID=A0ABX3BWG4_9MYCO|nr:hypothetical protein [Mycobacteroides saopaulense]OHT81184.1 hypothetical protein BKG68_23365 [Mycobacteroides saopaulense]OHU07333.1 hypothetical protein BKG73_18970 [Mycobacteroides saopaulense]